MKPAMVSGCRAGPPGWSRLWHRGAVPARQATYPTPQPTSPPRQGLRIGPPVFDVLTYEHWCVPAAGAPRLPAVCGGRAPGAHQEAGQVRQVDVHAHRQEWQQRKIAILIFHVFSRILIASSVFTLVFIILSMGQYVYRYGVWKG
jgi:hypothetical protein